MGRTGVLDADFGGLAFWMRTLEAWHYGTVYHTFTSLDPSFCILNYNYNSVLRLG